MWRGDELDRIILPVRGAGMWSMIYGYIALQADLNTVAGMTFYEQNETPGLGDQITRKHWLEQWQGREVYNDQGKPVFRVSDDTVRPGSDAVRYEVDALSGGDGIQFLFHIGGETVIQKLIEVFHQAIGDDFAYFFRVKTPICQSYVTSVLDGGNDRSIG